MTELDEFLSTVIPRQEAADDALHNGDARPRFDLYSHEDPVTLLGAFGVMASGWPEVSKTFEWVASTFERGESFRLEVLAAGLSGDLAYTVGLEHSTVIEKGESVSRVLRVTHVYRREDGDWKIVHRHGDGLATDHVA